MSVHEQRKIIGRAQRIMAQADEEGRELTAQEQREIDRALLEADKIHIEDRATEDLQPISGRPSPTGESRHRFADGQDAEVRALRDGESAYSYLESRGLIRDADRFEGLSLGGYLRSILIGPDSDVERRALAEGTDASGGFTVPDVLGAELIDRLRPQSTVLQSGARIVPIDSDSHSFAKVETDPTPSWRAENDPVAESDPTFGRLEFVPKSVAFMVRASRELLQDSVNLEEELPRIFGAVMGRELDRVALVGDSSNGEPVGLMNASGADRQLDGHDRPAAPPTSGPGGRPVHRIESGSDRSDAGHVERRELGVRGEFPAVVDRSAIGRQNRNAEREIRRQSPGGLPRLCPMGCPARSAGGARSDYRNYDVN